MSTKSLWGQLPTIEGIRTPTQVLKEQATALTNMTNSVLQGDVSVGREYGNFSIDLNIVAPMLDNYHYHVVRATHGLDLYPVTIAPGWELYDRKEKIECADESELETALGKILSSQKVRSVVASLLAQSRAI
jgi:hypothetical protein